jgi:hypothetical protein
MANEEVYVIPSRFRKLENLHIVFWLLKDMSWAMLWKPLGIMMIAPTLIASIIITYQTRKFRAELFHNIAVTCWICANAFWMICEFMNKDNLRIYTSIPFTIGMVTVGYYYFEKLILKK